MSSKTAEILTALRTRIEGAGHTVFLGRVIDPEQDTLPVVTLRFQGDGETTISTSPKARKALDLVAELWTETYTDDPLLELIPLGDGLEEALVVPGSDATDRLGGAATNVEHVSTSLLAHDEYSHVGVAQVAIRVSFVR
jgi:hypothetical protein